MTRLVRLFAALLFVVLPPMAGAQENGQGGDSDDLVVFSDKPSQAGATIAPPSDHWVYRLPNAEQTKLVTVTVTALDNRGRPVPNATVLTCCVPWDFTSSGQTDGSGRVSLRGPIGDWSFYVGHATKTSGLIASLRGVKVEHDTAVRIQAGREIEWRWVTPDGRPFPVAQSAETTFMPTDIVGAAQTAPSGSNINVEQIQGLRGVGATLPCGPVVKGVLRAAVSPDCSGTLSIAQAPIGDQPGLFLWNSVTTQSSANLPVNPKELGRLVLSFDGYRFSKARTQIIVKRRGIQGGQASAVIWVSPTGGKYTFLATPGEYLVRVAVSSPSGAIHYLGHRVTLKAGQEQDLTYGSRFEARLNVRKWFRNFLDLWFDILDDKGNYLLRTPGQARLKLGYDGKTIFDDNFTKCQGRWFRIDYDFGRQDKKRLDFRYSMSSSILGEVVISGQVPEAKDESLRADLPVVYASDHFVFRFRENWPEVAKRGADNMEAALKWLVNNFGGPIQMRGGGKLLEVRAWTPVGVGASGGDAVRIDIYSAHDFDGVGRLLFHELGHAYVGHPPHHPPAGIAKAIGEPLATLIADYCIRAVAGERAFHGTHSRVNNDFFNVLMSPNTTASQPKSGNYMFIFHYIHDRYGQAINSRFFQALYADKGNLAQVLAVADFLNTDSERTAAAYSCLTGVNLGWLYRWAGFNVTDEKIDQALRFFKDRNVKLP